MYIRAYTRVAPRDKKGEIMALQRILLLDFIHVREKAGLSKD